MKQKLMNAQDVRNQVQNQPTKIRMLVEALLLERKDLEEELKFTLEERDRVLIERGEL